MTMVILMLMIILMIKSITMMMTIADDGDKVHGIIFISMYLLSLDTQPQSICGLVQHNVPSGNKTLLPPVSLSLYLP